MIICLCGCTENTTGLQKKVINTGYEMCSSRLNTSMQTAHINNVAVYVGRPTIDHVYKIFGDQIIEDGKIMETVINNGSRFREMLIVINYGMNKNKDNDLTGKYKCRYLYRLNNDHRSPELKDVYLYGTMDNGKDNVLNEYVRMVDAGQPSFTLGMKASINMMDGDSKYDVRDEKLYTALTRYHKAKQEMC